MKDVSIFTLSNKLNSLAIRASKDNIHPCEFPMLQKYLLFANKKLNKYLQEREVASSITINVLSLRMYACIDAVRAHIKSRSK